VTVLPLGERELLELFEGLELLFGPLAVFKRGCVTRLMDVNWRTAIEIMRRGGTADATNSTSKTAQNQLPLFWTGARISQPSERSSLVEAIPSGRDKPTWRCG
jgi:hypothetical protein